jgi:Tfp pilus assembly protein PilF
LFPDEANSWGCLAWAHKSIGDTENTARYCRRALDIDPENEIARKVLAEMSETD